MWTNHSQYLQWRDQCGVPHEEAGVINGFHPNRSEASIRQEVIDMNGREEESRRSKALERERAIAREFQAEKERKEWVQGELDEQKTERNYVFQVSETPSLARQKYSTDDRCSENDIVRQFQDVHTVALGHANTIRTLLPTRYLRMDNEACRLDILSDIQKAAENGHADNIRCFSSQIDSMASCDYGSKDKKTLDAIAQTAAKLGHVSVIRAFIESKIKGYDFREFLGQEYRHWYGRFFGVSRSKKLAAAQYLLANSSDEGELDISTWQQHKSALSEGDLGKLFSLLKTAKANFKEHSPTCIANLS